MATPRSIETFTRKTTETARRQFPLTTGLPFAKGALGTDTPVTICDEADYSLQGQRKTRQGSDEPDRDAQFRYICKQVKAFQKRGQAVISVDTKKKELLTLE